MSRGDSTIHLHRITDGTDLSWAYDSNTITTIIPELNLVSDVEFPDLVSQISFVVSAIVNGRTLECSGVSTSSGAVSRTLTLQVEESIR